MLPRLGRPASPRSRALTLLVLLSVMFLAIVVRLTYVQVISPGRYVAYGEAQRIQPIEVAGGRGAIYDRNGEDLAISIPLSSIAVDPSIIDAPAATAARLAPILGIEASELRARMSEEVRFVWLARQVEDNVADAVRELDIPGVILFDEQARFTPSGDLATSLLGTVDRDSTGVSGVELAYEELLSGESGRLVVERDLQGRTIPAGRHHIDPARPGHDLILTIDHDLQYEVENVLQAHVTAASARGGTAIVMNPETGEILALANQATDEATGIVHNTGNNLAVTANYEPGSVNKVITVAAALEEGLVTPDQVISVPAALRVADHTYEDAHPGNLSVTDIVAQSSNVGTIKIAQELGAERLDEYLRRFGFGRDTGLGLPNEENGLMLPLDRWSGTSIGSIPLGQGIGVTALQMLLSYNVLANDGVYVPPSLVAATRDTEGERNPVASEDSRRVVSPTTASQLRAMLTEVIDQGTGAAADIEGYDVAGKTGTARKPQPEGGGYENPDGSYDYIATFAGFFPADDPKLSIIVVIDEPANGYYASEVAAPAFADIGRRAARTMAVAPSLPEEQAPLAISTADGRVRATPAAPPTTVPPSTTLPPTAPTSVPPGAPTTTTLPPAGAAPEAAPDAAAAAAAAGTGPPADSPGG